MIIPIEFDFNTQDETSMSSFMPAFVVLIVAIVTTVFLYAEPQDIDSALRAVSSSLNPFVLIGNGGSTQPQREVNECAHVIERKGDASVSKSDTISEGDRVAVKEFVIFDATSLPSRIAASDALAAAQAMQSLPVLHSSIEVSSNWHSRHRKHDADDGYYVFSAKGADVIDCLSQAVVGATVGSQVSVYCCPDSAFGGIGFPQWGVQPDTAIVIQFGPIERR